MTITKVKYIYQPVQCICIFTCTEKAPGTLYSYIIQICLINMREKEREGEREVGEGGEKEVPSNTVFF